MTMPTQQQLWALIIFLLEWFFLNIYHQPVHMYQGDSYLILQQILWSAIYILNVHQINIVQLFSK